MVERNDISEHEVRVWSLFEAHPERWMSNIQVAAEARVCRRTARAHTLKLIRLGLVEVATVFPGYRYRLRREAEKRNVAYYQRLKAAQEVFGGAAVRSGG